MRTTQLTRQRAAAIYRAKRLTALSVACLAAVGLTACGNSGELPANAVARVGNTTITTALFDHWMLALLGSDYSERGSSRAPAGLVGDPPGYGRCPSVVKAAMSVGPTGQATLSAGVLERKCQQLNEALKQQTMSYLILSEWIADQEDESGEKITESELHRRFASLKAELFPTEADLASFLASRDWTLSDELFSIRRELLSAKLVKQLAKGSRSATPFFKKWTAVTNCRPGYVVEQCKQYKASSAAPASPSIASIVEELSAPARAAQAAAAAATAALKADENCKNEPGGKGYRCVAVPLARKHGT
jgi:hypothetical protein